MKSRFEKLGLMLGINKPPAWGKDKAQKAFFQDTAYLSHSDYPDAVICVAMSNYIKVLDKYQYQLNVENAGILKNLANHYNVKIIGCTMYEPPANRKEELLERSFLVASGISEIYYASSDQMGHVAIDDFDLSKTALIRDKNDVYQLVSKKYKINKDHCLIADISILQSRYETHGKAYGEYEVVPHVGELPEIVPKFAKKYQC